MTPLAWFLFATSAVTILFSIFLHYSDKAHAEEAAKTAKARKAKK
ncbi:MAG: hypothetical protein QM523_06290 [Candidatus Pacebacteria bacterium]|nr:hypothetical protein [Candidatus Paceibacterota bacterium]